MSFLSAKSALMALGLSLTVSAIAESFLFDRLRGLAGPFEGIDAVGHAFLVEKLGDVGTIPLYAYWTSDESAPHGLLGPGWHIPLLESRIVPMDGKTYEFLQPDGQKRDIRVSRGNAEILTSNRMWSGEAKGDKISLKADVGDGERYTLSFRQGRLVQMKVEEGTFDFAYSGASPSTGKTPVVNGLPPGKMTVGSAARFPEKVSSRGQALLTIARDARNPSKIDFLFAGKASASFVREADKVTIIWSDGRRKTFVRGMISDSESLKVDDLTITWNRYTRKVIAYGDWSYTFGKVKPEWNTPSIDRLHVDGRREFYWFNLANGKGEFREANGVRYRWARFPSGDLYGLMRWSEKTRDGMLLHRNDYSYDSGRRLVYNRLARGEEEVGDGSLPALEERWYAADGTVRRVRLNGKDATP